MKHQSLLLTFSLAAFLTLSVASVGAETVSSFGIQGELLPEWDVLTTDKTLIFRANTQDAYIRVCKADIAFENDAFEQPARAYAKKMGGKKLRYVEGNLEFETAQGEQAFLQRFGRTVLFFVIHGESNEFYRVLGSIKPDRQ
ncbi:MAG: hypothetical protein K6G15_01785 [Desulfovibrio sp.]|nr:hypothetical protein [Desulfovibrio sp.]